MRDVTVMSLHPAIPPWRFTRTSGTWQVRGKRFIIWARPNGDWPTTLRLWPCIKGLWTWGKRRRNLFLQGQALIDLGDVHERKKDFTAAIELYHEAIQCLNAPEDWQESARALRQLGDVYVATGNFESAYGSYSLALQQAVNAKDPERIAEFNDYIGFCHRQLGDYQTAIEYHRRALDSEESVASADLRSRARARSLNHLGLCIAKIAEADVSEGKAEAAKGKYREAIAHEEEALGLAVHARDRWRQGYVLRALSAMHRELGVLLKSPEASRAFQRSLSRADEAFDLGIAMKEKEWQGLALHDRALTLALLGRDSGRS